MNRDISLPTDPPDPGNFKSSYAKITARREKLIKSASESINLNVDFKWDTFVVVLTDESGRPFRQDNLDFVDIFDAAIFFGFSEEELYGANPRHSFGHASFYTAKPIDVRDRAASLKKEYKKAIPSLNGVMTDVCMRIKGSDKLSQSKKKLKISALNTIGRFRDEKVIVSMLSQFGSIIDHHPSKCPPSAKAAHLKRYSEMRGPNYEVIIEANPDAIPQILPINGQLVTLRFEGARQQCYQCFSLGHTKMTCNAKKVQIFAYDRILKEKIQERMLSLNGKNVNSDDTITSPEKGKKSDRNTENNSVNEKTANDPKENIDSTKNAVNSRNEPIDEGNIRGVGEINISINRSSANVDGNGSENVQNVSLEREEASRNDDKTQHNINMSSSETKKLDDKLDEENEWTIQTRGRKNTNNRESTEPRDGSKKKRIRSKSSNRHLPSKSPGSSVVGKKSRQNSNKD